MSKANDIVSIILTYGGFCSGTERRTITFDNEDVIVESELYNCSRDKAKGVFNDVSKRDFLSSFRDLHTETWKSQYFNNNILDGTQWNLSVEYADGEKEEFHGSNEFPGNFESLLKLMKMKA